MGDSWSCLSCMGAEEPPVSGTRLLVEETRVCLGETFQCSVWSSCVNVCEIRQSVDSCDKFHFLLTELPTINCDNGNPFITNLKYL